MLHKYIKRIERLESQLLPAPGGAMTFEEYHRRLWRENKKAFLKAAKGNELWFFVEQFQCEDEDRKIRGARSRFR